MSGEVAAGPRSWVPGAGSSGWAGWSRVAPGAAGKSASAAERDMLTRTCAGVGCWQSSAAACRTGREAGCLDTGNSTHNPGLVRKIIRRMS